MKSCYQNILESSTVTLSAGAADASYPLYRLWDRDIGRPFKAADTSTLEIKIDQGAAPLAIDRLIVPAGHNMAGMTLDLQYSDDNVTYTSALGAPFVQPDTGLIQKSFASSAHRYWEFAISGTIGAAPQLAEMFLSPTSDISPDPDFGWVPDTEWNVQNDVTAAGQDRFLELGGPKEVRKYDMKHLSDSEAAVITALKTGFAGKKPFWFYDLDGNWYYMKATSIYVKRSDPGQWDAHIELKQVLG